MTKKCLREPNLNWVCSNWCKRSQLKPNSWKSSQEWTDIAWNGMINTVPNIRNLRRSLRTRSKPSKASWDYCKIWMNKNNKHLRGTSWNWMRILMKCSGKSYRMEGTLNWDLSRKMQGMSLRYRIPHNSGKGLSSWRSANRSTKVSRLR